VVADPTGLEHLTPVVITDTSATERGVFRRCRRQWLLSVVNRLDPQAGNVHFFLGNLIHKALESYYLALKDGKTVDDAEIDALDIYQDTFDEMLEQAKKDLGFLAATNLPTFREAGEMGLEMLQNYMEHERVEPLFDEIIAVEFRVNVPIGDPPQGELSVQADVIGRKDGWLGVVDHKTASTVMPSAHLDLDDQLTAEVYSWWKHSGEFPEFVIYNVLYKKVPHPPRLLKSGKLSKDKAQVTTAAMYRAAIKEHGLATGDYADVLVWLDERERSGDNPLFRREQTFRTKGQMAAFERDLYEEWQDMVMVASNPEAAYPNPTSMNCSSCPVRVICTTIQDGGDVEAVIKGSYVIAEPRR
jgi:hypothetical protein